MINTPPVKSVVLIIAALASVLFAQTKSQEPAGELVIFHAGSLSVPMRKICSEFNKLYPEVKIYREAAGSRMCARKISDLHRPCDVMASADYTVIDALLIPEFADWNIKFAANEMVVAYMPHLGYSNQITKENWWDTLLKKEVAFGRSDPNCDPCGYRSVLVMKLAERFYKEPGLARRLISKDRKYIRPKETDLLALLETGELDYIFIYRSVAAQHQLEYLSVPEQINLSRPELSDVYDKVSVRLTGRKPGEYLIKSGAPIVYGVTIPKNAPNSELAKKFLAFMLEAEKGGTIFEQNGQDFLVPAASDTFEKVPESLRRFVTSVGGKVK